MEHDFRAIVSATWFRLRGASREVSKNLGIAFLNARLCSLILELPWFDCCCGVVFGEFTQQGTKFRRVKQLE
ncbi:hypothetical protein [Arthrobacter sp. PAMC 25486]|uniref:hypothetical protein n=1 Tax=Arthrobacter sp. PAMC 25486 TaxID=1494608 RepID=UPI0020A6466B|nr:hypothetical protein [Arthrobacter sp. PAMC 25486]